MAGLVLEHGFGVFDSLAATLLRYGFGTDRGYLVLGADRELYQLYQLVHRGLRGRQSGHQQPHQIRTTGTVDCLFHTNQYADSLRQKAGKPRPTTSVVAVTKGDKLAAVSQPCVAGCSATRAI